MVAGVVVVVAVAVKMLLDSFVQTYLPCSLVFGLFCPDPHLLPLPRPNRLFRATILFYRYPLMAFGVLVN